METNNVVLLRGILTNDPVVRALASGDSVTQLELSTQVDGRTVTVPVSVSERVVTVGSGDVVVVTGYVRRRFFRAGGVTQSRTEVVADEVIKVTRKRTVQRAIEGVLDAIGADG
jgi:single-strand DNA-binding protein